jgi:hypothetical protein
MRGWEGRSLSDVEVFDWSHIMQAQELWLALGILWARIRVWLHPWQREHSGPWLARKRHISGLHVQEDGRG